jgi:PHS family inorganic phosphate transporter-like MFS transporter
MRSRRLRWIRLGRKTIQGLGFGMMAVTFGLLAFIPNVEKLIYPFLIIYGFSYFFTEFGPNATTFVYPSEIFPVKVRTTGHGIAAAMGKIGGFSGVFTFPFFMHWHGLPAAEGAAAIVSVLGLIVTIFLLPETKGKSLEELSTDQPSTPDEMEKAKRGRLAAALYMSPVPGRLPNRQYEPYDRAV